MYVGVAGLPGSTDVALAGRGSTVNAQADSTSLPTLSDS